MGCQDIIIEFLNDRSISMEIRQNVSLSHYTTMRVGGSTPAMFFPNKLEDCLALLDFLDSENIAYSISQLYYKDL